MERCRTFCEINANWNSSLYSLWKIREMFEVMRVCLSAETMRWKAPWRYGSSTLCIHRRSDETTWYRGIKYLGTEALTVYLSCLNGGKLETVFGRYEDMYYVGRSSKNYSRISFVILLLDRDNVISTTEKTHFNVEQFRKFNS